MTDANRYDDTMSTLPLTSAYFVDGNYLRWSPNHLIDFVGAAAAAATTMTH